MVLTWDQARTRLEGLAPRREQDQAFREAESLPGLNIGLEAGTGTGKTMFLASRNGQVSTYATATNDQLAQTARAAESMVAAGIFKDAAILMGRDHYQCDERRAMAGIEYRGELVADYPQTERGLVRSSRSFGCAHLVCGTGDAYHRAQSAALEADLLLTNHDLLILSPIVQRRGGQLRVDEGHHFADKLLDRLGVQASSATFAKHGFLGVDDLRSAKAAIAAMQRQDTDWTPTTREQVKAHESQLWINRMIDAQDQVCWWEADTFRARPLRFGPSWLWDKFAEVAVMSATLHNHELLELDAVVSADSPFDLATNRAGFVLARDGGADREATDAEIRRAVAGSGRTLLLVNGYAAYPRLRALLPDAHFQERGEGARAADLLRTGRARIVVGTYANLGTGIDLPGQALSNVVLMHMPQGPFDPFEEALKQAYGSAWFFGSWYRPRGRAALAQAIGRLIRTPSDTGTVHFLDARARYKATFRELMAPSAVMEF